MKLISDEENYFPNLSGVTELEPGQVSFRNFWADGLVRIEKKLV